jgi:cytochrome c oxidase cbb3-type subunit 4
VDINVLREYQAYAYFFFVAFLVFLLYGYIYHLYKSEKDGVRDYEKYANIALDDEITSKPIEDNTPKNKEKEGAK